MRFLLLRSLHSSGIRQQIEKNISESDKCSKENKTLIGQRVIMGGLIYTGRWGQPNLIVESSCCEEGEVMIPQAIVSECIFIIFT